MMTYFSSTPIHGTGTATAAQIDAWFAKRGPQYASYAPDGVYKPAPAIGQSIVGYASRWGMNSDLVAGQMMNESAAWQSAIARIKNNPSGYGAENDDPFGKATTFPSPDAGIRATVAHLASYCNGHGDWDEFDPRQANIIAEGWLGVVKTLADLNGKWAFPGTTYGAGIAVLANDLVAFVKQTGGAMGFEMPGDINGIPVHKRFIPIKNSNRPGTPATASGQEWVTVHETANPSVGANARMHNEFVFNGGGADPAEGNDGVSFTFAVDDHEIWQNLPLEEKSWQASDGSNGDGNSSVSIETCINADGDWTKTKFNLAQLVAYLATHVPNKSMDRVAQHNKWARDHKNCPTRLRANNNAEWDAWLAQARGIAAGGVIIPPGELIIPNNPHGNIAVVRGFKSFVETLAAARFPQDKTAAILSLFGFPEQPEYLAKDGNVYQLFERQLLQWSPVNQPPFDLVMMRREDEPPEAAA